MKNKKTIISIIAVIVVAAIAVGVYFAFGRGSSSQSDNAQAETKKITLEIIADGQSKEFSIETDRKTLGEALVDSGYVKNDRAQYGLYIQTVYGINKDGRTADDSKQEWWCLTKDGQSVATGADSVKIADGEKYELTLKVGYDGF